MPNTHYPKNWELESLFPGGSRSEAFGSFLENLKTRSARFVDTTDALTSDPAGWVDPFLDLQALKRDGDQALSFVSCLTSVDMGDLLAGQLEKQVDSVSAEIDSAGVAFDAKLSGLPSDTLQSIKQDERLADLRFSLEERIRSVKLRLDPARESLAASLRVDGYQAWERLYYSLLNRMHVTYELDGKENTLSMGQAANKMGDPNRRLRQAVFPAWTKEWADHSELFAETLNHIAGFRLALYEHRGWTDVLQESKERNRISSQLLSTLWSTISNNKGPVVAYMERKAKLMGLEKLEWFDFGAPISEDSSATLSFDEAASFVVKQFHQFSHDMGSFAEKALSERWVEAEDKTGKRTGAFCTGFPVQGESRVFMTFSGTFDNMSTLAHELGHAYHTHVLQGLPYFATDYPMGLAESASTFAEAVIVGAALQETNDKALKISLLDQKIQGAVTFFMDIHSRFLFENRFYEARKRGPLTAEALCQLMEEAQKEAFCNSLASYHPYFWASKLHFYITDLPFYNFPYTIGFLFSSGLYARALAEGPSFEDKYRAILRDSGRMTMEDLARQHLGVDLTQPDFWQNAIDVIQRDIEEFLALTE